MQVTRGKGFFAIFVFTLLAGIWLFASPVQAKSDMEKEITKKNKNFTVDCEYGIDGWIVYGTPVMANVTIESRENFAGTLRIIPATDYGLDKVAYAKDISLAAGEAKTFSMTLSMMSGYGGIKVEILDEKNKVVYGEETQVTPQSAGDKFAIGILSDDYSALSYLDGIHYVLDYEERVTSIFELKPDSFPEDSSALGALQYIVIDNFDTSQLSDKQYKALKEWTKNGGVLILSLGSNYQNVLQCFQDDFVAGTVGKLEKKDVTWNISIQLMETKNDIKEESQNAESENSMQEANEETKSESDTQEKVEETWTLSDVDCVDFALNEGEAMADFAEGNVAYQKHIGRGNVVVLSYALGMEPVISYEERENIIYALLEDSRVAATGDSTSGNNPVYQGDGDGFTLANLANENAKPSTILYAVILIVYAVLVGPVLYMILKAVQKREKIWLAVPVVAVVFTGVIYLTGFLYRINKPLLNTFSVITLQDGAASEKVYTSITCPKAQEYSLRIKDGYDGFQSNMNSYNYNAIGMTTSSEDYDYMIKQSGDGIELTLRNATAFEEARFTVNATGDNHIGMIDCDLHYYTTGFEGTVTNNTCYDLSGVVVVFESRAYQINELKKGEQVTIDAKNLIEISEYDVLRSGYYNYSDLYTNPERYKNYQIIGLMENSFIDKDAYQQGCVWANIGSYKPDMLDGADVKQSGLGVVFQTFTGEYEDVKGAYYPNIDNMALSVQGDYDSYDRMIYEADVLVTYSFENYPGITTLTNLAEDSENSDNSHAYADVYAFNPETGDYEQIFTDSDTLSGSELEKYMNDDILMLKYVAADGYTFSSYMPKISARGEE